MATFSALVQPVKGAQLANLDQRTSVRKVCRIEATSRPLEVDGEICWGGTVRDISKGGLNLALCFPFRPGTYLAVDVQTAAGDTRTLVTRVVHVHDNADGTWVLGCEFLKPLSDSDVDFAI